MDDESLACVDCGARFEFSAEERARFQARQFASPKRCKKCRAEKRRRTAVQGGGQGAGQGAGLGAAQGGGGRRETGHNGARAQPSAGHAGAALGGAAGEAAAMGAERPPREDRPMHPAVCTVCQEATEVPFVPDGVRAVYCLPCLKQRTR